MVHYDENNHDFNGGQNCWDLSSDISKTSDLFPPTSNNVLILSKMGRNESSLGRNITWEGSGGMKG